MLNWPVLMELKVRFLFSVCVLASCSFPSVVHVCAAAELHAPEPFCDTQG